MPKDPHDWEPWSVTQGTSASTYHCRACGVVRTYVQITKADYPFACGLSATDGEFLTFDDPDEEPEKRYDVSACYACARYKPVPGTLTCGICSKVRNLY